jgi:hypothetical protein
MMGLIFVMFIIYFAPYIILAGIIVGVVYYIMTRNKKKVKVKKKRNIKKMNKVKCDGTS